MLAGLGILEHVDVDGLSAAGGCRTFGIGDDRGTGIEEWACGAVADGHADLLAVRLGVVGRVVEVVLIVAVLLFHLIDAGSPGIARGPLHLVALHIEHLALVSPVDEVR